MMKGNILTEAEVRALVEKNTFLCDAMGHRMTFVFGKADHVVCLECGTIPVPISEGRGYSVVPKK